MSDPITRLNAALEGRYRVESELGEGGMATVYLAHDLKHERKVALKVLKSNLAASVGPDRFLQEVRITANLQHPHILPLFDSGEADGFLFYVMPLIEGESLKERLAREGELPVADAARILRDVVDALSAAHKAGVVHRDIKPGNVLLSDRHAMVADFGVAKAVSEATGQSTMTTVGTALGTPSYMSPEQAAADEAIDHRTDIYAVGAMAYELLTGRAPFTGSTHRHILTAHITKTPDPVTQHRPSVPPALADAIMRCLEKKPADRWQTADELLPYLEAAATSSQGMTPLDMKPVGVRAGMRVWLKRIASVAAVVGALIGINRWQAANTQEPATLSSTPVTLRVLVASADNRSGDPVLDVVGVQAADGMRRAIREQTDVEVVAESAVQEAAGGANSLDGMSIFELAAATGASHVITTSLTRLADELTLSLEVLDAGSRDLLRALDPVSVPADSASTAIEEAGLRAAVAMLALGTPDAFRLRYQSLPRTPEAHRLMAAAQDEFQQGRWDQAIDLAKRATDLEPHWPPPYFVVRPALFNGGRAREWREEWESRLLELIPRMTLYEQAQLQFLDGATTDDRLRGAQQMFEMTDGWGGTPYTVAFRAVQLNRLYLAREALNAVQWDHAAVRDWSLTWVLDTKVYHLLGEFENEYDRALDGRSRFPRYDLIARDEARALAALGLVSEADSVMHAFKELPVEADSVWRVMHDVGLEFRVHGHPAASDRALDSLVAWTERHPDMTRSRRAHAYYDASRYDDAEPLLRAEVDETGGSAALARLIITLDSLGRSEETDQYLAQFPDLSESTSFARRWPAAVAASRGDAASAVGLLRRAYASDMRYYDFNDDFMHFRWEFDPIRQDGAFQALMRPKPEGPSG